jgi:hypothetical protein
LICLNPFFQTQNSTPLDRKRCIDQVVGRLQTLLQDDARLPCKFTIARRWGAQTDAPIFIHLEPATSCEGVFETEHVFGEIQQTLNTEFKSDPFYFGINIAVPYRFLGAVRVHIHEQLLKEQADDIARYRKVRLKDQLH